MDSNAAEGVRKSHDVKTVLNDADCERNAEPPVRIGNHRPKTAIRLQGKNDMQTQRHDDRRGDIERG